MKTVEKPDTEYLKLIEKKYKINISLLISNERFFNKWNQYYEFSSDEKLSILEQECKLFEKILDEVQPDFLITGMTTLHHQHLFYEICKARGIKVLMFRQSFFIGKQILSNEFHSIGNIKSNEKIQIIGAGSNTLVRDGGFDGIIIKFGNSFSHLSLFNSNIFLHFINLSKLLSELSEFYNILKKFSIQYSICKTKTALSNNKSSTKEETGKKSIWKKFGESKSLSDVIK